MIVTRAPTPGLGIITNWDFNAPAVQPLGESLLPAQSLTPVPSGELSLEGIDVFDTLRASSWAYEHRKWLVGGGLALAAFGLFKLVF